MMEGNGSEAASLAGHQGLDNLCWVYDNNHITIEGNTQMAFTGGHRGRVSRLWLERPARGRCKRHRSYRTYSEGFPADQGSAYLYYPGQPHRLRFATQTRHRRGAWGAPRRGGCPPAHAARRLGHNGGNSSVPTEPKLIRRKETNARAVALVRSSKLAGCLKSLSKTQICLERG
jgi:hypothetical protein